MTSNSRRKCSRFKSYTDINNYNNFLLELDKKQKEQPIIINPASSKMEIKKVFKNIGKEFIESDYNNKYFTGLTALDILLEAVDSHIDPNLYQSDEKNATTNANTTEQCHLTTPVCKKKVNIISEVNNINDLLSIIETYPNDTDIEYNINIDALHKIKPPLTELQNMIGMKDLKENIIDQIIFYIQNLHTLNAGIKGNDFMHTVIYGPPGTGKTEIAKIIGSIFSKLGVLTKGTFKKVTRADLIAGYLGQTALKTRDVIKESLGGVLFIDEAYSLGNEEKKDSFSKECIDTLCEALSDHKDNLMVIIAGYETDLNNCFFNYNLGLNSRFTWRFKTDEYTGDDLYKMV